MNILRFIEHCSTPYPFDNGLKIHPDMQATETSTHHFQKANPERGVISNQPSTQHSAEAEEALMMTHIEQLSMAFKQQQQTLLDRDREELTNIDSEASLPAMTLKLQKEIEKIMDKLDGHCELFNLDTPQNIALVLQEQSNAMDALKQENAQKRKENKLILDKLTENEKNIKSLLQDAFDALRQENKDDEEENQRVSQKLDDITSLLQQQKEGMNALKELRGFHDEDEKMQKGILKKISENDEELGTLHEMVRTLQRRRNEVIHVLKQELQQFYQREDERRRQEEEDDEKVHERIDTLQKTIGENEKKRPSYLSRVGSSAVAAFLSSGVLFAGYIFLLGIWIKQAM